MFPTDPNVLLNIAIHDGKVFQLLTMINRELSITFNAQSYLKYFPYYYNQHTYKTYSDICICGTKKRIPWTRTITVEIPRIYDMRFVVDTDRISHQHTSVRAPRRNPLPPATEPDVVKPHPVHKHQYMQRVQRRQRVERMPRKQKWRTKH